MKKFAVFALLGVLVGCSSGTVAPQAEFVTEQLSSEASNLKYLVTMTSFPANCTNVTVWAELRSERDGPIVQQWSCVEGLRMGPNEAFTLTVHSSESAVSVTAVAGSGIMFAASPERWVSTLSVDTAEHIPAHNDTDAILAQILEHSETGPSGQQIVVLAKRNDRDNANN